MSVMLLHNLAEDYVSRQKTDRGRLQAAQP
jgi:hypothetical protein